LLRRVAGGRPERAAGRLLDHEIGRRDENIARFGMTDETFGDGRHATRLPRSAIVRLADFPQRVRILLCAVVILLLSLRSRCITVLRWIAALW